MAHPKFFDRLYQGFEAEYLVASALFGAGLEAFKFPGDFGFDLLVSNQWRATRDRSLPSATGDGCVPFPYAIQVKSRRAQATDISLVDALDRRELETTFSFKQDELDRLMADKQAFLVCVLFMPPDQRALSTRPLIFWLQGPQLQKMHERQYLVPHIDDRGQRRLTLHVVYRFMPMMRRDYLADQVFETLDFFKTQLDEDNALLASFDKAIADSRSRMMELLPEAVKSNGAGSEYIAFKRCDWDSKAGQFGTKLTKAKKLETVQTDLANLGAAIKPFPIDDAGVDYWLTMRASVAARCEAQPTAADDLSPIA